VIQDDKQRQLALNPESSFIVQAPAGSGKTELLTQRFLVLLSKVEKPEEILALTFTRKAAGEMRERIVAALRRAQDPTPPGTHHEKQTWELARCALDRDQTYEWNVINYPNRLKIQTIDALCAHLTHRMPLTANFGATPDVAEDSLSLYELAATELLKNIESNDSWNAALEKILLHLDNNLTKVHSLLVNMLMCREHWLPYLVGVEDKGALRQTLESSLKNITLDLLAFCDKALPTPIKIELSELATHSGHYLLSQQSDSPITVCAHTSDLPTASIEHKALWQGVSHLLLTKEGTWRKQVNKTVGFPATSSFKDKEEKQFHKENKERMLYLLDALRDNEILRHHLAQLQSAPPITYDEQQWDIIAALIDCLPVLAAQLKLVFQQQGAVDFTEISQGAQTALGSDENPTELALVLDHKIHHILVDEFQDTSASQYQLLEKLTTGWQQNDGRTLFLVGDPMQSIYRFRQAEVGLFLKARQEGLGQVTLTPLTLQVNFRSTPGVVNWVNEMFIHVLPAIEDISAGAVAYSPSIAAKEESQGAVNLYPCQDELAQAQQTVDLIKKAKETNPNGSIAILAKARPHLKLIIEALNQAALPFQAVDIENLSDRTVIQDLWSLTQALLHPAHRIAWLSILRAPWCGLSLHDLHILAGHDHERCIFELMNDETRLSELSTDGQHRLERIRPILNDKLVQRRRTHLRDWIATTWQQLGGPACVDEARDLNDAEHYFSLLEKEAIGEDIQDFDGFETKLNKLFVSPSQENTSNIFVMTIHKSKGLEFDTVIIPGLERRSPINDTALLSLMERPRSKHQTDLVLASIKAAESDHDPIHRYIRHQDREKDHYESGRLFYVAATRARSSLHLLATVNFKDEEMQEIRKPSKTSLLGQVWDQVSDDITAEKIIMAKEPIEAPTFKQGLKRLTSNWQHPHRATETATQQTNPPHTPSDFTWEPDISPVVGTFIHRLLQRLCEQGNNTNFSTEHYRENWRNSLMTLGIATQDIEQALTTVEKAITNTLTDPKGQWILNNQHEDSQCEYPITQVIKGKPTTLVLDRTFIEAGTRWIVDYKTSQPNDGQTADFLEKESQQHKAQLEAYAKALSQLDQRPIKTALYFPLIKEWVELEVENS